MLTSNGEIFQDWFPVTFSNVFRWKMGRQVNLTLSLPTAQEASISSKAVWTVLVWDRHYFGSKNVFSQSAVLCYQTSIFYKAVAISLQQKSIDSVSYWFCIWGVFCHLIVFCCVLCDLVKLFYSLVNLVHLLCL